MPNFTHPDEPPPHVRYLHYFSSCRFVGFLSKGSQLMSLGRLNHLPSQARDYYENNSPENYFSDFVDGFWALKISGKERLFQRLRTSRQATRIRTRAPGQLGQPGGPNGPAGPGRKRDWPPSRKLLRNSFRKHSFM